MNNYYTKTNILTSLPSTNALIHGNIEAYFVQHNGGWSGVSSIEFAETVDKAAMAMETLGINVQERVAIFSSNRAGCLIADFAAYALRAIPV